MAWKNLSSRLDSLPLILAGPILRQVTPNAVTVWFALLYPANRIPECVRERLTWIARSWRQVPRPPTARWPRQRLGKIAGYHISLPLPLRSNTPLVPGKTYCYDANVHHQRSQSWQADVLAQAFNPPGVTPPTNLLVYDSFDFPSFVLPPDDLNSLRLVHGSCRKPHGGTLKAATNPTPDQLATLDGLIANDVTDPIKRPVMESLVDGRVRSTPMT